jgi:hypothetical protein
MDADEIRKLISWLQARVVLDTAGGEIKIAFDEPTIEDFLAMGFNEEMMALTLNSSWWHDMVIDIRETPDFVEPGEDPQLILKFARDVVHEYVGKRIL